MELIGSLRIINAVLVCETNKVVESGTSGEMCVVNCRFWHLVQAVENRRIFNVSLHFSVITLNVGSVTN